MHQTAEIFIAIGAMLLLGLAADAVGKRTFLPRVTLLLACGMAIGDSGVGLIPQSVTANFELIANVALMMVGFLLGGKLTVDLFQRAGRQLTWISVAAAVGTAALVTVALVALGTPPTVAVLLGCIAAATDAAATADTVLESGRDTVFARLLLAIVAIDDAWALILFSLGLAIAALLNGVNGVAGSVLGASYEILGALLLGGVIGVPAAKLTGRIKPGQPMLTEALGLVFLCGGAALWLDVSFLIATMTMGSVIANLAKHHEYPFHEIENVEWPFMVVFFMLAGVSLQLDALTGLGALGGVYLISRVAGKILGAWLGAKAGKAESAVRRWVGVALLPQAGVAIGMALIAAEQYPEFRQTILPVVIASTVLFELAGPVFTRIALARADRDPT